MKILFICSANVGRSQIAEGYYNYFSNSLGSASAALIEDRRIKYNYKPSENIIKSMLEDGIDISNQTIKLLTKEMCEDAEKIVLLLNPQGKISEFSINGEDAVNFLLNKFNDKIQVFEIPDPNGQSLKDTIFIRDEIKLLIKRLYNRK